jgi:hypothetical protein
MFAAEAAAGDHGSGLAWQNDKDGQPNLVWKAKSGRQVRLLDLRIVLVDPQARAKWSLKLEPKSRNTPPTSTSYEYALMLDGKLRRTVGSARLDMSVSPQAGEDALLCRSQLKFDQPVAVDLTVEYRCELCGPSPHSVSMPERPGNVTTRVLQADRVERGQFRLGAGAASAGGYDLGMPVFDFCWNAGQGEAKPWRLAVAADPYCGCSISGLVRPQQATSLTRIAITTTYKGSVVPLLSEKRSLSLEFHRRGMDGSLRSFYRTIPEIEPGLQWTQGVQLVYYDYLSEQGEGWFKDLQTLADRIPPQHRGRVALCMHGWYDYFQQYTYDSQQKKLLKQWIAFPRTRKIPMSLESMHKRLKFAKDRGFRVLLYFCDGTNSDSGAPHFHKEYLLKDKAGRTMAGWKGPDSVGQALRMDPSVPEVWQWHCDYLAALLKEYGTELDGFVWDQADFVPVEFVSYARPTPSYADRAMMSLMSAVTQIVQRYHARNPDLVFLGSDWTGTSYTLVANGTYVDISCRPQLWGPLMFANYRNCLWSCNWLPVTGEANNRISAEWFGLPQGVSNGWGDSCGPHKMPPEVLDRVLQRFTKNVETGRLRARCLNDLGDAEHPYDQPSALAKSDRAIGMPRRSPAGPTLPHEETPATAGWVEEVMPPPVRAVAEITKLGGRMTIDEKCFYPPVVGVDMSYTKATDAELEYLKALPNLQSLSLVGTEVTDIGLERLKGLNKLRSLNLASTPVTGAGLKHLKGLTKLQSLVLAGSKVTDAGLEHLKALPNLVSLDLFSTAATDAGLEQLGELPNLQSLNLEYTEVTDAELERLKGLSKLQSLNLTATKMGDAGLKHLEGLTDLQSLGLLTTKVTDAGLEYLHGMTRLESLDLGYNQVTDAGLDRLKRLTNLQSLNLEGTRVTAEGVKKLQKTLPKCRIQR